MVVIGMMAGACGKEINNMDDNTSVLILMFIFFGWIPILSLGKAISWCIKARVYKEK